MSNYGRLRALDDILKERETVQEGEEASEYMCDIAHEAEFAGYYRSEFVRVAALALAAIESIDSKEKPSANS
jgi:hypothetical protein